MRRTVRVAVALVVGQVTLCVAIGWVIFSYSLQHAHRGSAAVDQIAAPRPPIASSPSPTVPSPTPAPAASATTPRKQASRPAGPVPPRTGAPATAVPPVPPAPRTTAAPAPSSESPQASLVPPFASVSTSPSSSASATPSARPGEPVVVGAPCDRPGAAGRTADGRDVRCMPDGPYHLVWKIV